MLDLSTVVLAVCIIVFVYIFGPLLNIFYTYFIAVKFRSKRKQLRAAGDWAIVTGASDGIGKAYARELAKEGLNIFLLSIDAAQLEQVACEIRNDFHVETRTLVCDFFRTDIYDAIEKEINQLSTIACLVNNVGIAYPHLDAFVDAAFIDLQFIQNMLNCNILSMAALTRIVLPKMLKQPHKGCAIINLSSFSGINPAPYLSLYSATKACVRCFSQALSREVGNQHVFVQVVCPMFVATRLSKIPRPTYFVPSPETFVRGALDMLGVEEITMGYFGHALQGYVMTLAPSIGEQGAKSLYLKTLRRKRK